MKQNNQELVPQCVLVAAGQIVDEDSLRTGKPALDEVTVQVTAVMNTKSTDNELWIGQLVAWPKKDMAIFQSEPVLLHVETQSEGKHEINIPFISQSHAYMRIMPGRRSSTMNKLFYMYILKRDGTAAQGSLIFSLFF